jgi:hypothetical protein
MLLNEFIYFNETDRDQQEQDRYDPFDDKSILKSKDLRKTRLTLRMINRLRKAGESRDKEQKEDLVIVRQMYAQPEPEQAAGAV